MMPPRTALSTSLRSWRCPQCSLRPFSTTQHNAAFRPEHPRYIDLPTPPQQTLPYNRPIKGRLPVPRPIFHGKDQDALSHLDEHLAATTPAPTKTTPAPPGSHLAWKQNLSAARRRNLREGLHALRSRTLATRDRKATRAKDEALELRALRSAPQREDERLTAPSHGLDLAQLLHARTLPDPTRAARLANKRRNLHVATTAKKAERADHLQSLYVHARRFIVTPAQLDAAIEEEFDEHGAKFAVPGSYASGVGSARSMWNYGAPMTVQEMLMRAGRGAGPGGRGGRDALTTPHEEGNLRRVGRIAEKLTGGKMDGRG